MALINTSLPNLIQGVSQQPDSSRFDGQCEAQENALSSVVDGLTKRPNTRHVARLLSEAISNNSFIHFIDRDDNEKYVLIHGGTKLRAWNILTGVEATINGSTGGYTVSSTYLDVTTPSQQLKALTISDSTFLLNTNKKVEKSDVRTEPLDKEAWVFVKQGFNDARYKVILGATGGVRVRVTESVKAYYPTYDDLYLTITIENYASGLPTDEYISIEGFNGSTSIGTVGYVYVNERGEAEGLSAADGGTVQESLQLEAQVYYQVNTQVGGTYRTYSSDYFTSAVTTDHSAPTFSHLFSQTNDNSDTYNVISGFVSDWTSTEGNLPGDSQKGDYFSFTAYDNSILIKAKDASTIGTGLTPLEDFTISTTDSLSNTALQALYKQVNSITDLPLTCKNGFKIKIIGDADINQDDYYVEFQTSGGEEVGVGSWVECVGYNTEYSYNQTTLPHRLINSAPDAFTFEEVPWGEREAGDSETNPFSSFEGQQISGLFLYKNRLGFLSGSTVILSEAGGFFNFFRKTVTTLLDSAPIDVSVSSSKVTNLKTALGFQENLVMFSDKSQFVLKGGELLTPKTVSITPITNFDTETRVEPLPIGSYLYFPFTRGNFTGLREFSVNANTDTYDSVDVTDHVPNYIPHNIVDMAATTTEDIVALLSSDDPSTLYIYKYFWSGNQKVVSAWSKFTIEGDIRGIEFINSTLYMVVSHNSETQLLEMPLESGLKDDAGYNTYLDQRIEDTVLSGNSTITLPYTPADDSVQVYTKDGLKLTATNVGSTVTLAQPVSEDTDVWVGYPYTMKYTFSEQLFKASTGKAKSPSAASKLMVRNGALFFNDTAYFQVKVTPKARQTYVNTFTPDVVGSTTIGTLNLDSGFYRFPVFTKADDTAITIENDSALPSNFQTAEFESFVHARSNRYG